MKKTALRILTAVLALLLMVAAFSACGKKVSKKPEDAILNALEVTEKLSAKSGISLAKTPEPCYNERKKSNRKELTPCPRTPFPLTPAAISPNRITRP
jgi:hypothetical protein